MDHRAEAPPHRDHAKETFMAIDAGKLRQVLDQFSLEQTWAHMEWMSREIPERISGWPAAKRQADYLTEQLKRYGYDARQDEFPGLVSYPRPGSLTLLRPEPRTIEAMTFAHSTSTPEGGVEGELVYVGAGGESDYEGKEVRGKIVLAELSYAPPRPEKTRIATLHGAIGLILINWGEDDNPSIPMGTVKSVWGNPTVDNLVQMPNLPAIGIARVDGVAVRELARRLSVRARVVSDADRVWRTLHQPLGILGRGVPQFILIGDHMDSWGGGATDNASGNAVTLEVARILAEHRDELRRDVWIAFWQAHENGIMEGSTWFVDRYWDEITRRLAAYINIDSPGMKYAEEYSATLSPDLWTFHQEAMNAALGYTTPPHRLAKTGDQSFFGTGTPAISGRSSFPEELVQRWHGGVLGPWYQSADDTMEVADRAVLAQDLKMTLAYAWELATRPVLPFDYREPARLIGTALDAYQQETDTSIDLEHPRQLAGELRGLADQLWEQTNALSSRFTPHERSAELEARADALNIDLTRLSATLNPLLTSVIGRYGQDTYGLTALSRWVPSLAEVGALHNLEAGSGDHMLWWSKLARERNRVTDQLQAAVDLVKETLGSGQG
jgi:hypothetical protein